MADPPLVPPQLLRRDHDVDSFDCGSEALNDYLRRFAWINQQSNSARTYVAVRRDRVIGYYTLAYGGVAPDAAPPRIRKGLPQHPIPVMVLARLAVDRGEQGVGIGKALLKDALLRTLQAADIAGLRAIVVHAKHERARDFYEAFRFQRSPIDPFHLMLLLKDLRRLIE